MELHDDRGGNREKMAWQRFPGRRRKHGRVRGSSIIFLAVDFKRADRGQKGGSSFLKKGSQRDEELTFWHVEGGAKGSVRMENSLDEWPGLRRGSLTKAMERRFKNKLSAN